MSIHTDVILLTFIRTEITAGLMFAELSAGAERDDRERRDRHLANAEWAYESAVKLLARVITMPHEAAELRADLETLRAVIAGLKESH